jgi:hypothetical protein
MRNILRATVGRAACHGQSAIASWRFNAAFADNDANALSNLRDLKGCKQLPGPGRQACIGI